MGGSLGRNETRRRKGRQIARGEVIRAGDAQLPAKVCWALRFVCKNREEIARPVNGGERVDEPRALILVHVESVVGHPAYQVVASVRLKVPQLSHDEQFTIDSVTPPLLLHQWGLTLGLLYIRNLPCEIKLLSYDDYDLTRRYSLSNTLAAEQIIPIIKRPLRSITPNEFPLHQILHFRRFSSNS